MLSNEINKSDSIFQCQIHDLDIVYLNISEDAKQDNTLCCSICAQFLAINNKSFLNLYPIQQIKKENNEMLPLFFTHNPDKPTKIKLNAEIEKECNDLIEQICQQFDEIKDEFNNFINLQFKNILSKINDDKQKIQEANQKLIQTACLSELREAFLNIQQTSQSLKQQLNSISKTIHNQFKEQNEQISQITNQQQLFFNKLINLKNIPNAIESFLQNSVYGDYIQNDQTISLQNGIYLNSQNVFCESISQISQIIGFKGQKGVVYSCNCLKPSQKYFYRIEFLDDSVIYDFFIGLVTDDRKDGNYWFSLCEINLSQGQTNTLLQQQSEIAINERKPYKGLIIDIIVNISENQFIVQTPDNQKVHSLSSSISLKDLSKNDNQWRFYISSSNNNTSIKVSRKSIE